MVSKMGLVKRCGATGSVAIHGRPCHPDGSDEAESFSGIAAGPHDAAVALPVMAM
jgi:hypothetical protein